MLRFLTLFVILPLLNAGPVSHIPITVVDDLGRTVTLPAPAHRIVSLAPSITETLFAIGAANQIVGVTDYCNYPPEARMKQHVGGMINPNIEAIVGLHPDLIILSMEGNVRDDFTRLTGFGIPVFVSNPRTFAGIRRSIDQIGELTGHTAEAARLAGRQAARVDSIAALVHGAPIRTLCFVSLEPIMVVGHNTFVNELLERAGAGNLAAGAAGTYPAYSREAVLSGNPEVIIVLSDVLADARHLTDLFPEWRNLPAVQHHRVYVVNSDLVSRPGPRAVDGLNLLFHILHDHDS